MRYTLINREISSALRLHASGRPAASIELLTLDRLSRTLSMLRLRAKDETLDAGRERAPRATRPPRGATRLGVASPRGYAARVFAAGREISRHDSAKPAQRTRDYFHFSARLALIAFRLGSSTVDALWRRCRRSSRRRHICALPQREAPPRRSCHAGDAAAMAAIIIARLAY